MTRVQRYFDRDQREALTILAGGCCTGCGTALTGENMEADHRIPFSAGGPTTLENGDALCRECNRRKGARMPEIGESLQREAKEATHGSVRMPVFAPTPGFNDRISQTGFMSAFIGSWIGMGKATFLAEMGTGSGKTACGVSAARHLFEYRDAEVAAGIPLKSRRGVRLVIVMTPTTGIRNEWIREVERLAMRGGPKLLVREPMGSKLRNISGPLDFPADGTIVLASPQALQTSAVRKALRMMARKVDGEVAVVVEEVHHYSEENSWGVCLSSVVQHARVLIGLSGTPYRHDDGRILGVKMSADGEVVPDYRYSKAESLAHGVVAPLHFRSVEGVITEKDGRSGHLIREGKLSECQGRMADDFLQHALKPGATTLNLCLEEGIRSLTELRATNQGDYEPAGAIQCATQSQLRYIQDYLEQRGYVVKATYFNDGQNAEDVIDSFRAGEGDWILGLKRLTEGVNIARLRVGVNVNYRCTTRQSFEQFAARMERLIAEIMPADQFGYIVIPKHHAFEQYAMDYEKEIKAAEQIRTLDVCGCPTCGMQVPAAASICPFCECDMPSAVRKAPWQVNESNLVASVVTQTAYVANFIYRAQSLTVEAARELAAAYDARCRAAGVPGSGGLSVEVKAFRELRMRRGESR